MLYASFAHNALWIPDGAYTVRDGFRVGYVGYDSDLVMNRIGMAGAVHPLHPLYWWDHEHRAGGFAYRSQFGAQGIVLGWLHRRVGGDVEEFAAWAACGCALLTALALAAFFGSVARRVGPFAADAAVLLTASTPILLPFASSLYWACFLSLAPFVLAWLLYPRCEGSRGRMAGLMAMIAALVGLKCLCGYEYVSTVVLSPAAAVAYRRAAVGDGLRRVARPAAALALAGGCGFAGAVGLHALQLHFLIGRDGLALIGERATATAVGGISCVPAATSCLAPDPKFLPTETRPRVRCLINYFWLPAAATPATWGPLSGFATLGAAVLAAAAFGRRTWRTRALYPSAAALVPAAAVGLVGAAAWHFVAVAHSCIHMHLNLICYAIPFFPLAYALVGWNLGRAVGRLPVLRFAPAAVAVLAIVGNAVAAASREAGGEVRARAEARVEAMLRGEATATPAASAFVRPPLLVDAAPRNLGSEAWAHCRLRPDFNGHGAATRFVSGFVVGGPTTNSGPTCRVVAVAGGRVLRAEVSYGRIALPERLSGGRTSCTSFAAAVPDSEVRPGESLRLFAVSGDGGGAISELAVP